MIKKLILLLMLSAPCFATTVALTCTPGDTTATAFHFYRSKVTGGPYTQIDTNLYTTCAFNDTMVVPGETWFYVATASNSLGPSAYSNEFKAVIPGAPLSPKTLTGKITP